LQYRAGFNREINDGVHAPTKVAFLQENKLKALKVSCGFDHSLLLAQSSSGKKVLYSIGKDETNFKHLGAS